ncbi:MAG: glycine zipper 2TM domain-containing protein [Alphaproteobacteria bacterium]|nr:glycine zipper 2TM domain-containing protein [Alphaproteobacteria bacterium]MBR3662400.1 glycine zipper 2TM domain-containing protein [Alphaproteobacteria bacterium]
MNKNLLYVVPAIVALAACAPRIGSNDYSYSGVRQTSNAFPCTVLSVRQVNVSNDDNSMGTMLGGVAGGVAGSTIGHGRSAHTLGAIGGAAAGMLAGNLIQDSMMKQGGYEYIVRTDNGQTFSVTQGTDTLLNAGQRCMLINGAESRVIPYY